MKTYNIKKKVDIKALLNADVFIDSRAKYTISVVIIAFVHGILLLSFINIGADIMAVYNCFSVLSYIICALFTYFKGKYIEAFLFSYAEIIFHSLLASILLGWDFGFPLYLIGLIPIGFDMAFMMRKTVDGTAVSFISGFSATAVFFLCRYISLNYEPLYMGYPQDVVTGFYMFNVLCIVVFLFSYSYVFYAENKAAQADLEDKNKRLEYLAGHDMLTQLCNRRMMHSMLDDYDENGRSFCVMMFDIDFFKKINDTYGHDCGDEVLRLFSGVLTDTFTGDGQVCRWGGEEFMIVSECSMDEAYRTAEEIRKNTERISVDYKGTEVKFTVSCGISERTDNMRSQDAVVAADKNLYIGKKCGRNCVIR